MEENVLLVNLGRAVRGLTQLSVTPPLEVGVDLQHCILPNFDYEKQTLWELLMLASQHIQSVHFILAFL